MLAKLSPDGAGGLEISWLQDRISPLEPRQLGRLQADAADAQERVVAATQLFQSRHISGRKPGQVFFPLVQAASKPGLGGSLEAVLEGGELRHNRFPCRQVRL